MEWIKIEEQTPDKYPIDINGESPHFLAISYSGYVREFCWHYPAKGSTAYKQNYPPSIIRLEDDRMCKEPNIKYWIPLPKKPKGGDDE